ncbi:MobC family plasmid mobilization relaxosome protein [Photobacterium indicum]
MNNNETSPPKRTELVSFRLTKDEYRPYKLIVEKTDLSKSDLFRRVFLSKDLTFNVKENKPIDYTRLVFYFNKSSNNINQIAHKINEAHRSGVVSERLYTDTLNRLITIERLLKKGLDKC